MTKLEKRELSDMTVNEMMSVEGGLFGVDDAIFWGCVITMFVGGTAVGVTAGISRKNR